MGGKCGRKKPICRAFRGSTPPSTPVDEDCSCEVFLPPSSTFALWKTVCKGAPLDCRRDSPFRGNFSPRPRETDLSAQRAQAEASPRLPCANVLARRAGDPQASPREG